MEDVLFHVPNQYRVILGAGLWNSSAESGNNGAFLIPGPCGQTLKIIASNGLGWEHVSVSLKGRIPFWMEMCAIKDLFWDPEDCVIQFHPPKSEYVNNCNFCLHLWRPIGVKFPMPDKKLVGIYKGFSG